jgi:hypothetical protein
MVAAALTLALTASLTVLTGPATAGSAPGEHTTATIIDGKRDLFGGDLITSRNGWALSTHPLGPPCIGCPQRTPLRERVPGKDWAKPRNLPSSVYEPDIKVLRNGSVWMTYVHDGSIWVAEKTPEGKRLRTPVAVAPWTGTLPTGGPQPRLVIGDQSLQSPPAAGVLWAEVDGGYAFTERRGDGTWSTPAPLPFQNHPNGWSQLDLIDYTSTGDLLMMWTRDGTQDTWYTTRTGTTWDEPFPFPSGPGRIRPLAIEGDLLVYEAGSGGVDDPYRLQATTLIQSEGPEDFTKARLIDSGNTGPYSIRVLTDDRRHLTLAWADGDGRYPMLWSPDRPGSYLRTATTILGEKPIASWDLVTTPTGTLGFAYTRADQDTTRPLIRFRYLPAGSNTWTSATKIRTDGSPYASAALLGDQPADSADGGTSGSVTLRENTRRGAVAHTFTHPEPVTEFTGPARTQTDHEYTLTWKATWVEGTRWQMRYTTTRRDVDGWQRANGPVTDDGKQSLFISHVRNGETLCFQVRTRVGVGDGMTPWSKQRCITVRT